MGFFAVVSDADSDEFQVEMCHLNLWALGGLLGYRVSFLDVGLLLHALERDVETFSLALPFATRDHALDSLYEEMIDGTVASLIFARDDVLIGHALQIRGQDQPPVPVLKVSEQESVRKDHPDRQNFSLWQIALNDSVRAGHYGYARMRFAIDKPGRLWVWRPSVPLRAGAVVDLRICDEREAQTLSAADHLTKRMVDLDGVIAFVMALAVFQAASISPVPRYIRSLEGRVWERYLDRATDLRRSAKFLVYRWTETSVSAARPFRGLIQFSRHPLPLPTGGQLVSTSLLVALLILVTNIELRDGSLPDALDDVLDFGTQGWLEGAGTLAGLCAAFLAIGAAWKALSGIRRRITNGARWIDSQVYRLLAR